MTVTVHISETIRCVVKDLPKTVVLQKPESTTIRQLAVDIGIPPILIVFAMVDGAKKSMNEVLDDGAQISFFGTMAGG